MIKIIKDHLQALIDQIEPQLILIDGPDYYSTQSALSIHPELLIVGINPYGEKKLSDSHFQNKKPKNLIYDSNQYLTNPNWRISKILNYIFSGENSASVYENANIINYIPINTKRASDLNTRALREIIANCKQYSEALIYDIIKPKHILLLGPAVAKMMGLKFDHSKDSVLRTENNKSYLVIKIIKNNIPHYLIYHPSARSLNDKHNLILKKHYFETLFTK